MENIIANKIVALENRIADLRDDPRLNSEVQSRSVYKKIEECKIKISVLKEIQAEARIRATSENPAFNFNRQWYEIGEGMQNLFAKKVGQIADMAISRLAEEFELDEKTIREVVEPLNPELEWESLLGSEKLPEDMPWTEFEMQYMRDEIIIKHYNKR